ncbi:MAG: hypothetical protein A4C66_11060 [Nitrospira sp. HN-bin3]|uniref:YgaP family membrane protein n=1 Tax=Nitrospira cf. moscoviensis SBR1015 TaxID=96242 RepID=UPI000A0E200F|nr:DUF2892 domain-containing protein [Nitrospira cf. moscoviensis SBR1015]OQW39571.1 MAG: hypothetical protein A4C66_11060 [Nitrospira sp. HN-bin3]
MTCNAGGVERPIRMGIGAVAILIGLFVGLSTGMAGAALTVGAILLLPGAVGFCPLFMLFGISTCSLRAGVKK